MNLLIFAGAKTEHIIQRAKSNQAGKDQNSSNNHKYNTQASCNDFREEQHSNNNGDSNANNPISSSHILSHSLFLLVFVPQRWLEQDSLSVTFITQAKEFLL